jgi:hypothetical protein
MTFSAEHLLKKTTANAASDILNIETRVDNDAARSSSADAVVAVVDNTTSDLGPRTLVSLFHLSSKNSALLEWIKPRIAGLRSVFSGF